MSVETFCHRRRVLYSDCTLGNHVYYGHYPALLEGARNEFFRHLGHPFLTLQETGVLFPVIEMNLKYRAPARYDDMLEIRVQVQRLTRVRLSLDYVINQQTGKRVLEAATHHGCTDLKDKVQRIPIELARALAGYLSE